VQFKNGILMLKCYNSIPKSIVLVQATALLSHFQDVIFRFSSRTALTIKTEVSRYFYQCVCLNSGTVPYISLRRLPSTSIPIRYLPVHSRSMLQVFRVPNIVK